VVACGGAGAGAGADVNILATGTDRRKEGSRIR